MNPKNRSRGSKGFSLLEVTLSLGMLGFGLMASGAMQLQTLSTGASGRQYRQAVAVAQNQVARIQTMAWSEIEPTAGFEAPVWLKYAGYPLGDVPVAVDPTGPPHGPVDQVYSVDWRVDEANTTATLRDIDVRVTWVDAKLETHTYATSVVRSK